MGLFSYSEKPAPKEDLIPDRKKGFARFAELLDRDGKAFYLAGMLALLGLIPYILGLAFAIAFRSLLLLAAAAFLGGMLAAPQVVALADTVMRSLRDDRDWWWFNYRAAWKRNAGASLIPGGIFGMVFGFQIFLLYMLAYIPNPMSDLLVLLLSSLVTVGIFIYFVPMLATVELPFFPLLKNALILLLMNLPKTLGPALFCMIYALLILYWFPLTTLLLLIVGLWLPMLVSCNAIYPILNETFSIEESLSKDGNL